MSFRWRNNWVLEHVGGPALRDGHSDSGGTQWWRLRFRFATARRFTRLARLCLVDVAGSYPWAWLPSISCQRSGLLKLPNYLVSAMTPCGEGSTDGLCADACVSEGTWQALRKTLDDGELIELLFLIGYYSMMAGFLHSTGVQEEPGRVGLGDYQRPLAPPRRRGPPRGTARSTERGPSRSTTRPPTSSSPCNCTMRAGKSRAR